MSHSSISSRASSSSTPPPSPPPSLYEVFLSFRGETRHGFTDHLYKGLVAAGILVFRDKEGLPVGERNWPELVKAIEASKISIPIISPDYASSEWCLNELVQILRCKKMLGQLVIPIFYRVKPSDVRKKLDVRDEESQVCKKRRLDFDAAHFQEWRDALMEVSYLTGLESEKVADGYEGELVEIVVADVIKALKKRTLDVGDVLVGVEDRVKEIKNMVNVEGSNDVRAILIHGMGGIGKTTLAKELYNQLTHRFKCCSFLANIREASAQHKGKEGLQKQLISDILGEKLSHDISSVDQGANIIRDRFKCMKVLILLDDVDDQLNALARKRDWFGTGSIVIITSRRNDVLKGWEDSFCFELCGLNDDQSFQLFCRHAFERSDSIPIEYQSIAKEIASTTSGLPLAIEVIGCLLRGEKQDIWKESLKKLKEIPNDKVQSKLKISIDALKGEEREIFLDIACLPIHEEIEYAVYMWESCGFYPKLAIKKLISVSLIKIIEEEITFWKGGMLRKKFIIHDQLRDLGREIVRQESRDNPGERSRLWKSEEALEVLELKQGTPKVHAIILAAELGSPNSMNEQLKGMTKLKFLKLQDTWLEGDFENIFLDLRWLSISYGTAKDWLFGSPFMGLEVLILEKYRDLTTTPDFSVMKKLEVLQLNGCSGLKEIHPSIGKLCKTLKVLNVSGCQELEKLPIQVGKMEELRELNISHTAIREIPISKGYMTKLETIDATSCEYITDIPDSIDSLVKLQRLILVECNSLKKIPQSIGKLKSLIELDLSLSGVTCLPDSIEGLHNLERLDMSFFGIKCSPTSIGKLNNLTSLTFNGFLMETLVDFSNLTNLNHLKYYDYIETRNRTLNLGKLNQLKTLLIMGQPLWQCSLSFEKKIDPAPDNINLSIELPSSLKELEVCSCQTLQTLPNMSHLKNLSSLNIRECSKLVEINGLEGAKSLTSLYIEDCKKLSKLSSMGTMVRKLELKSLDALESLFDFSTLKKLEYLEIVECNSLVEIQGRGTMESLRDLKIDGCQTLQTLPNMSNLKNLSSLCISRCSELVEINGLEGADSSISLHIEDCKKFSKLSSMGTMVRKLEL